MSSPDTEAASALRCAAHPGTVTYLRCGQCGTPICPRCLVMTPVGAKCARCARARLQPVFVLQPLDVLGAALVTLIVALVLGGVGAAVVHAVPLAAIAFPFASGLTLGSLVRLVVGKKRGLALKVVVGIGVVVSFVLLGMGDFLLHGPLDLLQSGLLPRFLLNEGIGLVLNPFNVLFLALGVWVAVTRLD